MFYHLPFSSSEGPTRARSQIGQLHWSKTSTHQSLDIEVQRLAQSADLMMLAFGNRDLELPSPLPDRTRGHVDGPHHFTLGQLNPTARDPRCPGGVPSDGRDIRALDAGARMREPMRGSSVGSQQQHAFCHVIQPPHIREPGHVGHEIEHGLSPIAIGLRRQHTAGLIEDDPSGRSGWRDDVGAIDGDAIRGRIDRLPDLPLEDGDRFTVPSKPGTVNVVGAVYDQNSFLFNQRQELKTYVRLAGGPTRDADDKHAFIIRADGSVVSRQSRVGVFGNTFESTRMNPGDTVVVPEKVPRPSPLRNFVTYSQIFSSLALGAAAIAVLQ